MRGPITVRRERAATHPKILTKIHIRYEAAGRGLALSQLERAVMLSREKYCSEALAG